MVHKRLLLPEPKWAQIILVIIKAITCAPGGNGNTVGNHRLDVLPDRHPADAEKAAHGLAGNMCFRIAEQGKYLIFHGQFVNHILRDMLTKKFLSRNHAIRYSGLLHYRICTTDERGKTVNFYIFATSARAFAQLFHFYHFSVSFLWHHAP
jgi:hypothetical protein